MVKEMEAFSKTKIKGVSKNPNFGGKTLMHKSTLILDLVWGRGMVQSTVFKPLQLYIAQWFGMCQFDVMGKLYKKKRKELQNQNFIKIH